MQGQRSPVESFPEAFEFEHGASSSSSSMDQQSLWNTMLLNPVETQSMPEFVISTGEANMSYMNVANDDASRLSSWSSGGASSSQHQQNQGSLVENKLDHGWRAPLRINAGGGPRVDERRFETSNMLSLGNVNINLNAGLVDDGQSFSQSSSFSDMRQNLEYAADRVGTGKETSESYPYSSGHIAITSSSPCASSSVDVGSIPEDDGRAGSSLDGRRLACKRKNIEGFPGQSSASGNASSLQQGESSVQNSTYHSYNPLSGFDISGSSGLQPVTNSTDGFPQGFGTVARGMASECYPSASTVVNAESSHRNYRMRVNPAQQHDIYPSSIWSTTAIRRSHQWQLNQPHPVPLNHAPEPIQGHGSSNAQSQHHIPVSSFPQSAYHLPWNGASNSRIGSSSSSFNMDDRMVDARIESNLRNMPVTSNLDFVPATETQPMAQDPVNWNLGSRVIGIAPASRAGSSSAIYPSLGSPWVPYQPTTQYPRSLSEAVHQSLFASGNSESGSQGTNFPMQRVNHSYNLQELVQLRASIRELQPAPHVRSGYNVERQNDGLMSAPLNIRNSVTREGRQRMISEIRHALESMRNANGIRFEDMFMIDQTVILAGADMHDRHRDMRLDVDNMSYEELLALGERIGNVSTGLTEETVSKSLKQRRYVKELEELMDEEPCCICQEQYVEGEDLGRLDCGHDFHTSCIKQWLMHKNICPICKSTGLGT